MKKNKTEGLILIVFLVLGLIFIGVGVFINRFSAIPKENKKATIATIVDIINNDKDYDILITYEVDNVVYEKYLNSYSSSYYEGKEITIYYDKNNPMKIINETSLILIYVFVGIGSFFILIAGVIVKIRKRREKNIVTLKETGNIVNAKYLSTEINENYSINNAHPYKIVCEWNNDMDGKKYIFKSENVWIDPEPIIKERNIKTFRVYFNPNNLKQYYMDVEMLTDNAIDLR